MADNAVIESLKKKVGAIIADNERLRSEVVKLKGEKERLAVKNRGAEERIILLEKRINTLETAAGVIGNKADNRAARLRINRLLREIDGCIAMLNR